MTSLCKTPLGTMQFMGHFMVDLSAIEENTNTYIVLQLREHMSNVYV